MEKLIRKSRFVVLFPSKLTKDALKEKLNTLQEILADNWPNNLKRGIILEIETQEGKEPMVVVKISRGLREEDTIPLIKTILTHLRKSLQENALSIAIKIFEEASQRIS